MDENKLKEYLAKTYNLVQQIHAKLKSQDVTEAVTCDECYETTSFTYDTVDASDIKKDIEDFNLFNGYEIEKLIK